MNPPPLEATKLKCLDGDVDEQVAELLTCGVCFNEFTFVADAPDHRPVLSNTCPHTLCFDCVKDSWNKVNYYKGECPFCRKPMAFTKQPSLNLLALNLLRSRLQFQKHDSSGDDSSAPPPVCIAISHICEKEESLPAGRSFSFHARPGIRRRSVGRHTTRSSSSHRTNTNISRPSILDRTNMNISRPSILDSSAFITSEVCLVGNGYFNSFYDHLSNGDWNMALGQVMNTPWHVPRVFQGPNGRQITSLHTAIFFGAPDYLIHAMVVMAPEAVSTRALFPDTSLNLYPKEWAERMSRPDLLRCLQTR